MQLGAPVATLIWTRRSSLSAPTVIEAWSCRLVLAGRTMLPKVTAPPAGTAWLPAGLAPMRSAITPPAALAVVSLTS